MAAHLDQDENKILLVLGKIPFSEEEKQAWIEEIRNSGMHEELAKEIHTKTADLPKDEANSVNQARNVTELNRLINHWRLSKNLAHAHGRK